jgi:hypothetical protein
VRFIRNFTRLLWRLVIQGAVAILLIVVGGAFRELFSLAIFAEWLFYMVAASTISYFANVNRTQ